MTGAPKEEAEMQEEQTAHKGEPGRVLVALVVEDQYGLISAGFASQNFDGTDPPRCAEVELVAEALEKNRDLNRSISELGVLRDSQLVRAHATKSWLIDTSKNSLGT